MTSLIAFLNARLDEDEHIARMAAEDASASANWHVDARYEHSGHAGISGENGEIVVYDEGSPAQMEAEHIARHDPARALREVEAKRAIMYRCVARMNEMDVYPNGLVSPRALLARQVLMDMGAVWSDHPDYRQEWAP